MAGLALQALSSQRTPTLHRRRQPPVPTSKMFALSFFYVLSSMLLFRGVLSAPACELSLESRSTSTSLSKRAVPAAPRFVVYSDKFVSGLTGPPPVSEIAVRITSLYSIRITLIKSSRVSTSCAKSSGFFYAGTVR